MMSQILQALQIFNNGIYNNRIYIHQIGVPKYYEYPQTS